MTARRTWRTVLGMTARRTWRMVLGMTACRTRRTVLGMTARRLWHAALVLLLVFALAAPLAACGKRGKLEPPPGEKSDYPRNYPRE